MNDQFLSKSNRIYFSKLSNDFNPIHLKKDYLPDTQFEENLEYGANILLLALEHIISTEKISIESITCDFIKPIKVNSDLSIKKENDEYFIKQAKERVARFKLKKSKIKNNKNILHKSNKGKVDNKIESLEENDLLKMIGKNKSYFYSLDIVNSEKIYPILSKFCPSLIKDICFVSYIIGMKIPGEHSILSKIDYKTKIIENKNFKDKDIYVVKLSKYRKSVSLGTLQISAHSSNIRANFFLRPSLKTINKDTKSLLVKRVDKKYKSLNLLVLGGSKGIGLDIATYFSSLGLNVTTTYRSQRKYLEERLEFLSKNNLKLNVINFDSKEKNKINFQNYDLILNFITPKIMRGIKGDISFELFQDFSNNYVGNIISIAKLLSKSKQKHLLVIPSTIAVTETPIGMVEYAAAKAALEIISKGIEKTYTNLRIICPRLERVKTFQTLSIINKGKTSAEASLELGKIILENIDSFLD